MSAKPKLPKIGKIELPIGSGASPYVPKVAPKFIDHGDVLKTLAIGISDNLPVLMIGESGTGKTSAIRYLAHLSQNGLRRVNLNGGTTADELVGRLLINEKGTYWVDGVLTEAMRNGEWIVLDEINAALPEVLFVLQSVLDDDGYLVLNEKDDKEIVRRHKDFRLFATCNPPEYAGTKEMNRALLSRFPICINAEYPPPAKEGEIIEHHLGNAVAKSQMASALIKLANDTRKQKESGKIDYAINTRDILNALRITGQMEPIEALMLSFGNKLDTSDAKSLRAMARLELPTTKKGAAQGLKQVKAAKDLEINGSYVMKADVPGVYIGVDHKPNMATLSDNKLGDIVKSYKITNATRGDEFDIKGFFQENGNKAVTTDVAGKGKRIASIIEFTKGANKGGLAILIHSEKVNNSDKVLENLYAQN